MAERRRFTGREYAIGVGIVLVCFAVVYLIAGALNLPVPQWVLSGLASAIGVGIWFAVINRTGRTD